MVGNSPPSFNPLVKIGFIGNTNNYPFRLAQALRRLGHEVVFFVDRPPSELRHRPESHYTDIPYPYPDWIQEIDALSPVRIVLVPWTLRSVVRTLEACDGVVLNGLALSLGTAIHRPLIGLLTGSDLDVFSNPKLLNTLAEGSYRSDFAVSGVFLKRVIKVCKRMIFSRLLHLQRAGIGKCSLLDYAIPGLIPEGDALLDKIGVDKKRRTSFMITETEDLPASRRRADGVLRIFCATRLQWRRSTVGAQVSPLDSKGTDVMLEGLRLFVATSRHPLSIHLISVGTDVEAAERYIKEIGLTDYVSWHPELSQQEFLAELAQADVVLENFGIGSCIGMAGRDAIAMGKPVVAWGKSDVFKQVLGEPLPIYEARTATEICAQLSRIIHHPDEIGSHVSTARAFAARWFSSTRAAEQCLTVFRETQKGK